MPVAVPGAAAAAVTIASPYLARAAEYPSQNIDVITPTREGGGADRNFRAFTSVWKKYPGTNFEPGFHPGASGRVGYEIFIGKADPNAYNLIFGNMGPEVLNWVVRAPNFSLDDYFCFGRVDTFPARYEKLVTAFAQTFKDPELLAACTKARGTPEYLNFGGAGGCAVYVKASGLAYAQYKNAMARVAVSVELHVTDRAEVRLIRAAIAADAGRIVDPDGLAAQLEGGFLQAASWTLCEEVTFGRNGIRSTDWESYPVLRFDNIPEIGVILLDDPESRSPGAGEAACGLSIAAIANALFNATSLRMRRLPFTPGAIRARALGSPA